MWNRLFALFAFLIIVLPGKSQFDAREAMDKGACRQLKGNIALLIVPVNTPRNVWHADAVSEVFDYACRARMRLQEEAESHGVALKIFVAWQWGVTPVLDAPRAGLDVPTLLAATIGHDSLQHYCDDLQEAFQFEQVAVLFAEHGKRTSYTMPCTSAAQKPYEEGLRYFFRPEKERIWEDPSTTIAHELLHLFGAMDLYDFPPTDPAIGPWVRTSIMGPTIDPLNDLVVDPLTAYLIGWREHPDPSWTHVFAGSPMRARKSAYR